MTPLNLAPVGSDLGGAVVIVAGIALAALTYQTVQYVRACVRRYRAIQKREASK